MLGAVGRAETQPPQQTNPFVNNKNFSYNGLGSNNGKIATAHETQPRRHSISRNTFHGTYFAKNSISHEEKRK